VKLRYLDGWVEARRAHANRYNDAFRRLNLDCSDALTLPDTPEAEHHVFNQYVVRTRRRDELHRFLASRGIGTAVYYPKALHMQACLAFLGYREGDFPEAERAARETLALPVYPELTVQMQDRVIEDIDTFFKGR
jgi:dTDP-4-amino-4,6-dideoxygalactose transaminase